MQRAARELLVPLPLGPGDQDARALGLSSGTLLPVGILGTECSDELTGWSSPS